MMDHTRKQTEQNCTNKVLVDGEKETVLCMSYIRLKSLKLPFMLASICKNLSLHHLRAQKLSLSTVSPAFFTPSTRTAKAAPNHGATLNLQATSGGCVGNQPGSGNQKGHNPVQRSQLRPQSVASGAEQHCRSTEPTAPLAWAPYGTQTPRAPQTPPVTPTLLPRHREVPALDTGAALQTPRG